MYGGVMKQLKRIHKHKAKVKWLVMLTELMTEEKWGIYFLQYGLPQLLY